jgi:hypothetical protein
MEAYLCAEWDGSHIWAQWEPQAGAKIAYELRLRYCPPSKDYLSSSAKEFGDWQTLMVSRKPWLTFWPNKPPRTLIQGQVRAGSREQGAGSEDWNDCMDVKFTKSRCKFRISSQFNKFNLPTDVKIHAHVDGAACSYVIPRAIQLEAGKSVVVECEALASGGFMQLDRPGDFRLMPALGVVIENIEPSRNDIEPTGRSYSVLAAAKRDGPFSIAFLPPQSLG